MVSRLTFWLPKSKKNELGSSSFNGCHSEAEAEESHFGRSSLYFSSAFVFSLPRRLSMSGRMDSRVQVIKEPISANDFSSFNISVQGLAIVITGAIALSDGGASTAAASWV